MRTFMITGHTLAPPLSLAQVESYVLLAADSPPGTARAILSLACCVRDWLVTRSIVVGISAAELDAIRQACEQIPPGEARNAAYHLLWHVVELAAGRDPSKRYVGGS